MKRILKKKVSYFATIEGVKFYDANCEWTWTKSRKPARHYVVGEYSKEKQKQKKGLHLFIKFPRVVI